LEPYVPSAWFSLIFFYYSLHRAGYPFRQDDLSIDEWMALGELKQELEIPRLPDGK
jgi:hypothetical protein